MARPRLEERDFEAWFLASLNVDSQADGDGNCLKAKFNPLQQRDWRGWWSKSGFGGSSQSPITEAQYRGHFHDSVADDLLKALERGGSTVLKNVRILGINGLIAIPDGASKPAAWNLGYFIEVKTGNDPDFTENQKQVYPLICQGGHATSFDTRVSALGLVPGAPFPPMDILPAITSGPGQPIHYIDYCQQIGLRP